jgi:hypothetical protein
MINYDYDTGQYYFNPRATIMGKYTDKPEGGHRDSRLERPSSPAGTPLDEVKKEIQTLNERIFKLHKAFRAKA